MPPLLDASSLVKAFGSLVAVDRVNLQVEDGQHHGLIGPNGSGKSTLLKTIAGEYYPKSGTIFFGGNDITRMPPSSRARAGLAIKFQIASIFENLSVYDNMLFVLQRPGTWWDLVASRSRSRLREKIEPLLDQFGLLPRANDPAGVLSHGEKQWLEIAMTLATTPRLLLLDEPTAGMSPEERSITAEALQKLSCAMLVVEHDIDFVKDLCGRITVLERGTTVASGPPEAIESDGRVRDIYLNRPGA